MKQSPLDRSGTARTARALAAKNAQQRNTLLAAAALIGVSVGIAATVPSGASAQPPSTAKRQYDSTYLKYKTSSQSKLESNQIKRTAIAAKPTAGAKPMAPPSNQLKQRTTWSSNQDKQSAARRQR